MKNKKDDGIKKTVKFYKSIRKESENVKRLSNLVFSCARSCPHSVGKYIKSLKQSTDKVEKLSIALENHVNGTE